MALPIVPETEVPVAVIGIELGDESDTVNNDTVGVTK